MKTIFITGTSSGIGKETVKFLSKKDFKVIATARNIETIKEFESLPNVVIMPLDITDTKQIKEISSKAIKEYDIDILFNNAGYGIKSPLELTPEEDIRKNFDTVVIGNMLLTQEFIPHFKKRKSGLILTTTSLAGIIALPLDGVYGAAKRALTSMCESIYYELKPFDIKVKIIIPGATKTDFKMNPFCIDGYEKASMNQRDFLYDGKDEGVEVSETVETIWEAINDNEDKIHYPSDKVALKLYNQYMEMGIEKYKEFFYKKMFL